VQVVQQRVLDVVQPDAVICAVDVEPANRDAGAEVDADAVVALVGGTVDGRRRCRKRQEEREQDQKPSRGSKVRGRCAQEGATLLQIGEPLPAF
jgi:hypothetical protein